MEASAKCGGDRRNDLLRFNGRYIDASFIGTSKKGGITRDNITGLMLDLFKNMYPDLADEDGKRILWLTDWHDSRLSEEFLRAMREAGVIMMGWLPNTTSVSQLADVALFGAFKVKRESLEKACQEPLNRVAKVRIACQAMRETFTQERIEGGAKSTGMLPINRKALLEHPCINDGDTLHNKKEVVVRTAMLNRVQSFPASHSIPNTPLSDQLDDAPLLDTPQRTSSAESTFTSISQQKPRLGHRRSVSPEELEHFREQIKGKYVELEGEMRIRSIPAFTKSLREKAELELMQNQEEKLALNKQKEELDKMMEELEKKKKELDSRKKTLDESDTVVKNQYRTSLTKLHMEHAVVVRLKDEATTGPPELLPILEEKYMDLTAAERSIYGLSVDPRDNWSCSLPQVPGLNVSVLETELSRATDALGWKKSKRGRDKEGCDEDVSFKIGTLINHYDEIEGTSDAIYWATARHEQRKEEEARLADGKAEAAKNNKRQKLASLPQRMKEAAEALSKKETVGNCRAFLKVFSECDILKDTHRKEIKMILAMKGNDLISAVKALYLNHSF
jgi:hypothetical protein